MSVLQEELLNFLAWAILALPVAAGCFVLWRTLPNRKFLMAPQRQWAVPWTGGEVFLAFLGYYLWPNLAWEAMRELFGPPGKWDEPYRLALALELTLPLHLLTMLGLMRLLSGTRPYQIGLHGANFQRNVLYGAVVWLVVCVPIFAIQLAVQLSWGPPPTPHAMERLIRESRPSILEWQLLLWVAIIIVPWTEEFIFRGVLQRWAGQLAWRSHLLLFLALLLALSLAPDQNAALGRLLFVLLLVPGYHFSPLWFERFFPIAVPYRSTHIPSTSGPEQEAHDGTVLPDFWNQLPERWTALFVPARQDFRVNQPRAVYASAMLFSVAHSWPDCIPIFFLGLALGWLAYRTQSLLAPVTLHALFNAVACFNLLLQYL
jgi:membrane protease YdiL (CAAX protease family)